MKWKLELPYMTPVERARFKSDVNTGKLTSFRRRPCAGIVNMDPEGEKPACPCPNEVPKIDDDDGKPLKRYCSQSCYTRTEEPIDEREQENEEW